MRISKNKEIMRKAAQLVWDGDGYNPGFYNGTLETQLNSHMDFFRAWRASLPWYKRLRVWIQLKFGV